MIEARFVIREWCVAIREASNGIPAVRGGIHVERATAGINVLCQGGGLSAAA
jgi:hypothetical protein